MEPCISLAIFLPMFSQLFWDFTVKYCSPRHISSPHDYKFSFPYFARALMCPHHRMLCLLRHMSPPLSLQNPHTRLHMQGDAAAAPADCPPPQQRLEVVSYTPPNPGPYPQNQPPTNRVRFTPVQVEAIMSGAQRAAWGRIRMQGSVLLFVP